MHDETLVGEFTRQSKDFNDAPVFSAEETLGTLVEAADPQPDERWLESACGTGHISRALAPRVREVHGVDLTAAMLEKAREQAAAEGLDNVSYAIGDATALEVPDASFDAAVTRFSLHHIPLPGRVVTELARAVRSGGKVLIGDHITDEDSDAQAWHLEIERLRDPSHWACLTRPRLRGICEQAGLTLESEQVIPFGLDFDLWVRRGSGGPALAPLIEEVLSQRPSSAGSFEVVETSGRRQLRLRYWLSLWRR